MFCLGRLAEPWITKARALMAAIAKRLLGRLAAAAEVGLVTSFQGAAVGGIDGAGAGDLKGAIGQGSDRDFGFAHWCIMP